VSWGLAWIRSATQPARLSALKALGPPLLMRPTQTCALPHPGQCLAGIQWIEWRVGRKGVGVVCLMSNGVSCRGVRGGSDTEGRSASGRVCQPSPSLTQRPRCSFAPSFLATQGRAGPPQGPPHHSFPPTPCSSELAPHPRLRIGWAHWRFPWVSPQGCVGLCQPGRTPRPAHKCGTPLPPLGNEEAHRGLGPSDMGPPGPIKPRQTSETTQFEAGQGGAREGSHSSHACSGRTGRWRRASQSCRDISTMIQPASLMPHSHRRPPFLDAH
jgi:hypothetical protein